MLDYNYDCSVESAYIIRIKGNSTSETMAARCALSCEKINMPYKFFDAVDGTKEQIQYPENVNPIVNLLKLTNATMTKSEIACCISHFLLWVKCVELDKPIVILEHDAIMIQSYLIHPFFNIISFLGSNEQVMQGWPTEFPIPPHAQLYKNYRFICRAHAYAIDPMIARQMVAKMIKVGLVAPLDIFIRIDEFAQIQQGIYAFDKDGETTITGRTQKIKTPEIMQITHDIECT